jgi:hypothetical protein
MAFILPKGFVKNDANIGESIEHYALEPLDIADIVKFWKGNQDHFLKSNRSNIGQFIQLLSGGCLILQLNVWKTIGGAYGEVKGGS